MNSLRGKNVVIIGGSEGVGRNMAVASASAGASVLAVARRQSLLDSLADAVAGIRTLAADMTDESTPGRILEAMQPDVIVVCAGATPAMRSIQDHSWQTFSSVWDNDVRGSFNIVKTALHAPLAPGSTVVLVSSGAAFAGSPMSGSYAGAKRMQMFMAEYAQEESDRHELGIRFLALVPRYIMTDTRLGKQAAQAYADYRGVSVQQFTSRFPHPQSPSDVADALITLLAQEPPRAGTVFCVDGERITEIE